MNIDTNKNNRYFFFKGTGHKQQPEVLTGDVPDQQYDELMEYARNSQSEEFENFLDEIATYSVKNETSHLAQ